MSAGVCLHCGRTAPRLRRGLCDRRVCFLDPEVRKQYPPRRWQRSWTHAEIALIHDRREMGLTYAEIGSILGRPERAIESMALRTRGPECIVCGRRCPRRSHLDRIGWQTQPAPWGNGHVVALCPGCFKLHGWGSVPERATV